MIIKPSRNVISRKVFRGRFYFGCVEYTYKNIYYDVFSVINKNDFKNNMYKQHKYYYSII